MWDTGKNHKKWDEWIVGQEEGDCGIDESKSLMLKTKDFSSDDE